MIYRRLVNGNVLETKAEEVIFEKNYDVIVAGLGTAGTYAVIAAASQKASVLGIEQLSGAGGMGTVGYVSGYYYGNNGGLYSEIDNEAANLANGMFINNVEPKKYLMEKKMKENNGELLFESVVTGVYLDGNTVKGVSVLTKGKQRNFSCRILIDATADAYVCMMAGCKTNWGRESDGKTVPFTSVKISLTMEGRISRTNHDSGFVNQYDPFELSKGILHAHASQLLDEFKNRDEKVLFLAPFIGIREGQIIEAEKIIRINDAIACKSEKEPLFYAYADFDKHGKDNALESEELQDWYVASNLSTVNISVPVTLLSLIPKGFKSIMVAGRHLGQDHNVAALIRMKRDMQKCGESAGVCAALAAKKGVQPVDVPYEEIKVILEESGCLNEENNRGIWFDDFFRREKVQWMTEPEDIKAALKTDMPGIAIYSCKLNADKMVPFLKEWIQSEDLDLKYNSAIALGLTGEKESLPVLQDIVRNRDAFYFKDGRRTNQFRTVIAIYLLGKLGDKDSIPILKEILCNEDECKKDLYHEIKETSYKLNTCKNFNELYFQVISHSAIALTKIIKKHPEAKETGVEILKEAFKDNRHIINTTTLPEKTFEYESMNNIKSYVLNFCN